MIRTQVAYCIFYLLPINLTDSKSYWYSFYIVFFLFLLPSDDSEEEEEKGRPLTQEEEDIDIIRSWVEVGGHPAHQEEDAKELLTEVKYPYVFLPLFFH